MSCYPRQDKLRWALAACLGLTWLGWAAIVYDLALLIGYLGKDKSLPQWPALTTPLSSAYALVAIVVPSLVIGTLSILIAVRRAHWQRRAAFVITAALIPLLLVRTGFGLSIATFLEGTFLLVILAAAVGVLWFLHIVARESATFSKDDNEVSKGQSLAK